MHSDNFDLSAYFRRINYTGHAAADTATLHALMRHQLFRCPSRIWMYRLAKSYPWYPKTLQINCYIEVVADTAMRLMGYLQWHWTL